MKNADTTKRTQEKRKGFTKKIGNTTYDVSFHYSQQSRESMNDLRPIPFRRLISATASRGQSAPSRGNRQDR